ncbi:branched-chain amino acid ABC transporter permease [Terrihabitans soli]|uniref:Branched-chain amino acid ABC transporter permease n=1 Tax=Terrihabitans soli TaxID=708113 RepID=A0A6S6QWH2_9HYPH|nr:AzlC family ABC transporter permease [Terrihabitans soli]BCJ91401.1 branched-chain amino acid ABC transporter permease [Terrihabitans soli]
MRADPKSEFRAGILLIFPALVAVIPFALILGAAAAQKGLSPFETGLMSALVFAGGSQFVAVDLWSFPAPWLALGFAALLVNLRYVLMSASIARKLKSFPIAGRALFIFFLADETWAMTEKRAAETPLTLWFLLGLVPVFYLNWVVFTIVGAVVGSAFQNPERLGFDFAFTAIFIGLALGFWQGPRTGFFIAASAAASALTYLFVDGPWYVMAGAIAGIIVAAIFPSAPLPLKEKADAQAARAEGGSVE